MRTAWILLVATLLLSGAPSPARAQAPAGASGARELSDEERRFQEELRAPRPIEAGTSPWIDELTWMEVRDALARGVRTAIVPTGGIEQNGPYLVTGKHNVVLRATCESIALELGDALCAPVIGLVPEGTFEPKTGHMRFPGTIGLGEETFRRVVEDVASSLRAHGFTEIVLIGDSGGNQRGMEEAAERLNARWSDARAHYIAEYYDYPGLRRYMEEELGVVEPVNEGFHDELSITALMMLVDPATVRYEERVKAGRASINGVSITPKEETIELGRQLLEFRTRRTVEAIRAAIAAGGGERR